MPNVKWVREDHPLAIIHEEVQRRRAAHKIVDVVEITEKEYEEIREYMQLPEGKHLATIPPSGVYFEIVRADGTKYNPVEEAKNRKVQIATAADEVFKK